MGSILIIGSFHSEIVKWYYAGPRLYLIVTWGMKAVGMPEYSGKTLIHAAVSNRGDRATSVTHLLLFLL
jgi:hypothetical protein